MIQVQDLLFHKVLKIVALCCAAWILPNLAFGNMASPIRRGTATALPLVSTHVAVQHETLLITPAADFKTCNFDVTYDILADTGGVKVPMLFIAEHYNGGMKIWVDGKETELLLLPSEFYYRNVSPVSHFTLPGADSATEITEISIQWIPGAPSTYRQEDLHYFEFDLTKGPHQIRVQYAAEVWRDLSELIAEQKFLYALEPASHWHAFGALDIKLDLSKSPYPVTTNLGKPSGADTTTSMTWHFDQLPAIKNLEIIAQPKIDGYAQFMIDFGRGGFFWVSGILAALIHCFFMWRYRRNHSEKWFSWVWMIGAFVVALVPIAFYLMSGEWINNAIGPAASDRGDYSFLIVIFYPVILIGYGLLALLADQLLRKARLRRSASKN